MGRVGKAAIVTCVLAGVTAVGAAALACVDVRAIGRSDPRRAANYRPLLFNFSANYTDGSALGIAVGTSKGEAISIAERGGFAVEPTGWGDSRAGGADLYERSKLVATMLRQPYLSFHDARDPKRGMILEFEDGRVAAIRVHYINSETI
jgi:hypothetical protein